jgi:hypothetical protein
MDRIGHGNGSIAAREAPAADEARTASSAVVARRSVRRARRERGIRGDAAP